MITFVHPPRHRDPNETWSLLKTSVEYVPGQQLRYYLKHEKLMWLRRSHALIDKTSRVPMLLAHVPQDGDTYQFVPGGKKRV